MTMPAEEQQRHFEAAAFCLLVAHLREHTDIRNIDLMNLAGFCRNSLSNWYLDATREAGAELTRNQSREIVYGMPYEEWKARHQNEATDSQKAAFKINKPRE